MVCSPGTSSNSFITRTGLKKWVIATSAWNRSGMPAAMSRSGMPDVFELITDPSLRSGSTSGEQLAA